jgi:hypothetical protein
MLRAVTNKDFPMLMRAMKNTFDIELDYDPSFEPKGKFTTYNIFLNRLVREDPQGRIRIIFVPCEDLSNGWRKDTDVIGFNISRKKLIFIAVPREIEAIEPDCYYAPGTMEGYLIGIVFHELYENITGDVHHCRNPGKCINATCQFHDNGTCSACMGGFIDRKYPDIALEELYCEEHLSNLRAALARAR